MLRDFIINGCRIESNEPLDINRDTRAALERKGHVFAEKPGNMGDVEPR
jgi:hypothetical protein